VLSGKKSAGVTAGASTPDWIINQFVKNLEVI
jgi:4-hydroxy-3-methylbut-2-enyl diphosphate reductase IspH